MNITHIPVTRVGEKTYSVPLSLFFVFTVGIIAGGIFGVAYSKQLKLPDILSKYQSAAVINAVPPTEDTVVVETTSPAVATTPTQNSTASQVTTNTVFQENVNANARRDLALRITDRNIAAERLAQEVERTKNDSVALITAFNQNCGSWQDVCATPYASKLEANNARYNELVTTLAQMNAELTTLEAALSQIQ